MSLNVEAHTDSLPEIGCKRSSSIQIMIFLLAMSVIAEQGDDLTFAHIHADVFNSQFGISVYLLEVSDVERGCLAERASCSLKILVLDAQKIILQRVEVRIKTFHRPLQRIELQSDNLGLVTDTAGD